MKKKLFIVLLAPLSVLAAPSNDINYLMNAPLTLWDKGMLNISKKLDGIRDYKNDGKNIYSQVGCYATYDFDKNTITIVCLGDLNETKTKDDAISASEQIVENVRLSLGYYHSGNASYDELRKENKYAKMYPILDDFRHDDYILTDEPKGLGQHLEQITTITTNLSGYKDGGYTYCQATLQGEKPMCRIVSQEEMRKDIHKMFIKK